MSNGNAATKFITNLAVDTIRIGGTLFSASSITLGTGAAIGAAGNIVFGNNAGNSTITGTDNVVLGNNALDGGTGALSYCIAIGKSALSGALTSAADYSIGIGFESLKALSTGAQNVAVGGGTQATVTTGSGNTTMGWAVMSVCAAACSNNVGIGANALSDAMTVASDGAVAVGSGALQHLTSGAKCVGVGFNALTACTTGTNTAVGYTSQQAITTGTRNTTMGDRALGSASAAVATSDITAIGSLALSGALTAGANGSTAVGSGALSANTTGVNTALGYNAGNTATTGSGNTIVGRDADVDAASRAGCVILGDGAVSGADNQFVVFTGGATKFVTTFVPDATALGAAPATKLLPVTINGVACKIALYT